MQNQYAIFLITQCSMVWCQLHSGKWQTYVVPIPKTRPPKSIDNDLRPISLTAILSKILESLVGQWMLPKIADKLCRTYRSFNHPCTRRHHQHVAASIGRSTFSQSTVYRLQKGVRPHNSFKQDSRPRHTTVHPEMNAFISVKPATAR